MAAIAVICLIFLMHSRSSSTSLAGSYTGALSRQINNAGLTASGSSFAQTRVQRQQNLADSFEPRTLRERLDYQFPYNIDVKFPAYIWQTWKFDPSSQEFDSHLRSFEASWTEKNPGFVHEVVTDENALYLIHYLYAAVPEVLDAYEAMPVPVLKADFFRYLLLFARGGVYSDIDTEALKSISEWLPPDYDRTQAGLIVGIEADPDRPDWAEWYSRRIQFCQWTVQSKPGHPVLRDAVARITEDTLQMKEQGMLRKGKIPKSIVEYTGPAMWTDTLFDYFNNRTPFDFSNRNTNITWEDFTGMTEARKVGDVIVLPITSFSPGVGQMGAGDYEDPQAFVRHSFDGELNDND